MEHAADLPPLTSVQQCVVDALAVGSTITAAAAEYGVQRMTVYRWIKNRPEFSRALQSARADFIIARRDDLHHLSNRALETLLAVLDNPRASPAVQARTAMFILQRPQSPKPGWSMPEPAVNPEDKEIADSAIIEQDYDNLPGFHDAAQQADDDEPGDGAELPDETPADPESPAESAASEPPPDLAQSMAKNQAAAEDVTAGDEMLHDSPICGDVTSAPPVPSRHTGLRSCPVPPAVLDARKKREDFLACLDLIESIETEMPPGYEKKDRE